MLSDRYRSRRRRRFLWPIVISVVVGFALLLGSLGDGARSSSTYLEDLRSEAVSLASDAGTFRDLMTRLAVVDRAQFTQVLEDLRGNLDQAEQLSTRQLQTPSLTASATLFQLAVESWRVGLAGVEEALLTAADQPESTGSFDAVATALVELRTGDRLYLALLEEMARPEVPDPVSPMPEIAYLPTELPLHATAELYVGIARSPQTLLALRPALAVQQVTTIPEWVRDSEDRLVVEATETLTVEVVVANLGNEATEEVVATLELADGEQLATFTVAVPPLEPGASTAVAFSELAVTPGTSYALTVTIPPASPLDPPEDNGRSLEFRVNPRA